MGSSAPADKPKPGGSRRVTKRLQMPEGGAESWSVRPAVMKSRCWRRVGGARLWIAGGNSLQARNIAVALDAMVRDCWPS